MVKKYPLINNNKHKKYLAVIFLAIIFSVSSYAQQVPHYTQYLYNMQVLNPAYVGARADLSMSVLSRNQWVGIEGAPSTTTFSINGRTRNGLGLGFTAISDKIGFIETTNANIDASYTIITSQYGRLAFGLKGGMSFFDNNLSDAITPDNDTYTSITGQSINVGFGALYYTDKFFVGVSLPYLLKTSYFRTTETTGISDNLNYFITGGTHFELSENFLFKPSTIIKYSSKLPISVDVNANFLYKKMIEMGLSYRYKDSASLLFSVILDERYRVGYTYDYKLTNFGNNLGTHEIVLHIDLNFNRSSRWLEANKCFF